MGSYAWKLVTEVNRQEKQKIANVTNHDGPFDTPLDSCPEDNPDFLYHNKLVGGSTMILSRRFLISIAMLFVWSTSAHGFLRCHFEDATVMERSELVVVGHLEADSIQFVPHKHGPNEGRSWEHHATLVITEVLKGKSSDKRIPIVIHYGLTPQVGGTSIEHGFDPTHAPLLKKDKKNDPIHILDTGSSARSHKPLVSDAGKDNLWFLRKGIRRNGLSNKELDAKTYGILDPEDLRPLAMKDYFLAYLSEDPVSVLKKYVEKHPEAKDRVERYVDHLEVQKILKIEDPRERFDKLLPYYLKGVTWNMASDARNGILSCGKVAGEKFLLLFDDPKYKNQRKDIIRIWSQIGYKEATPVVVPLLVDTLKREDPFWATQNLEKGWWNDDSNPDLQRKRQTSYGEVFFAAYMLKAFPDPRSKESLELTKKRWGSIHFENPQIIEACEASLKAISAEEGVNKTVPGPFLRKTSN